MGTRGQKSGQGTAGVAFAWAEYIDGLIAEHGTLAALADRLAALRAYQEDVESVSRALRRLRTRGTEAGGVWGDRVLRAFGLPQPVDDRLRFMGQYHSRFVDLPLPLGIDLVQLWDRPPTNQSKPGRTWLSLAWATIELRARRFEEARAHLRTVSTLAPLDPAAEVELCLALGVLDTRGQAQLEAPSLAQIPALLAQIPAGPDHDCLAARYVGQRSHALNHRGEIDRALELHLALPDTPRTHPFARSRRANGIAYGLHRRGEIEAALREARRAASYAGDAGHVRLRAMALLMISRIGKGSPEAEEARARAGAIAEMLAEPTLRSRVEAAARDADEAHSQA
ncbi:MAG: hypothetical protein U1E65_08470 [Myxococcota bacterium]